MNAFGLILLLKCVPPLIPHKEKDARARFQVNLMMGFSFLGGFSSLVYFNISSGQEIVTPPTPRKNLETNNTVLDFLF